MAILTFMVELLSGAMLLLFSVRFMRTGIERLWNAQISSSLNENSSAYQNLAKGAGLGLVMQGSTVVMLIASGLAGTGAVSVASAALVALGADLGSALAVLFLQLPLSAVGPLAIFLGATTYLRAPKPRQRNFGRVVLGLGLIFLSLSMIRAIVEPVGAMTGTSAIIDYASRDLVSMALAGIFLTFIMHSSVAALLTAVAIANHAALDPIPTLAFMLGCNIGSALLSLWLPKYENQRAKSVGYSVAILRCGAALATMLALFLIQNANNISIPISSSEVILFGHLGFNIVLLILAPIGVHISNIVVVNTASKGREGQGSLMDLEGDSSLVLSTIKRKLSGMLDLVSTMIDEVVSEDPDRQAMDDLEQRMNVSLSDIRNVYAKIPDLHDADLLDVQQVLDFAIRVERCGDVISGKDLSLRILQARGDYQFTEAGKDEIAQLIGAVRRGILLAQETAWTADISVAERLVRHKHNVTNLEQKSRRQHLARFRKGNPVSLSSSNHHLEVIAGLKEINSKLATIGYAVLQRNGRLKKSRLKSSIPASSS